MFSFKRIQAILFLLFPVCLLSMENSIPKYFEFPKPTGPYGVGTKAIELTDSTRKDPETDKNRRLVMQAWYPTKGIMDEPVSPYTYEMLKVLKKMCIKDELQKDKINQLGLIRTYAVSDAPILKGKSPYPVVIFEHGYATARGQYSSLCEEIASHGYVVFMVMHTYITELTRFADGSETDLLRERSLAMFKDCPADTKFMVDSVQNGAFKELTPCCDFKNIGVVGHSLGGMMSNLLCKLDSRVKAGISLDGPLYGPNATQPHHKPFMFMIASTFYETFGDEEGLRITGITKEEFKKSLEIFGQTNGADSYKIVLKNADHCTFADDTILVGFLKQIFNTEDINMCTGTIDGFKASKIIRAYVCAFFDMYLKNQPSQLLDVKDKKYAEYVDFNCWANLNIL